MARMVEVDGIRHEFPDDATDEEIQRALSGGTDRINRAPVRGTEPKPSWFTSLMQGIGQGVSLGWGDEIMAGIKSMAGMAPSYAAELENQRGGLERAREANPGWYMGGEIGGSLPSVFIPMGAAARGLSLGSKIGRGAAAGGAQGAIYGAGTGEGASGKLLGASTGGVLGAGIGGAVAPVAHAGGKVIGNMLAGRAPRLNPAQDMVSRAFDADAIDLSRAPRLGDEGMLLDMGPNLTQEAGAIAAMPGEGQRIIRDAMDQRHAGSGGRVRTMMDRALGPEPNVPQTIDDMATRRRAQAGPLYDKAYATPTPISVGLQEAIFKRMPAVAYTYAAKLAKADGVEFSRELVHTGDTRALDYLQRGLEQEIARVGRSSPLGRAYNDLSRQMGDELTAANLPLKGAREVWSSSLGAEEALTAGQEVFRRTMSPNELMTVMARMTPAEREAFRKGARDAISEIMGTARNDAGAAFRELGEKGWNKEKLAILIGRDETDTLLQGLDAERIFSRSRDTITRNSETARRQAGIDRLSGQGGRSGEAAVTGALAGGLATGSMTGAGIGAAAGFAKNVALRGLDRALSVAPAELDRIAADMAKMLTAKGRQREEAIRLLTQLRTQRFSNQQTADAAARVLRRVLGQTNAVAQPLGEDLRRQLATPTIP